MNLSVVSSTGEVALPAMSKGGIKLLVSKLLPVS
jgi:hypothetical protein